MKKKIAFQKWYNPYGDDEEVMKNFKEMAAEEQEAVDEEEEYEDMSQQLKTYFEQEQAAQAPIQSIRVMTTPMGIIPLTEHTDAGKIFNFWVGHTNFNISSKIVNTIKRIPGVETLDIFTRYRFRVGIAKHPDFEPGKVLSGITKAVQKM